MSILQVSDLCVSFSTKQGVVRAVNHVNFTINTGEIFGIVGESGSGKSVIGAAILQILPHSAHISGRVEFNGRDLTQVQGEELRLIRGREIALVPQNPGSSLNPLLTNGWQIDEVYRHQGIPKPAARTKTMAVLKRLLFSDPEQVVSQYPHQISGGMQQRVVTAIGTAEEPSLIVADEPTKGLDQQTRSSSRELFRTITTDHKTALLLITHDLDLAEELCDRIAVMYAGEFLETGTAAEVLSAPVHPYTRGLCKSRPCNGLIPLEGYSPDLTRLPPGCHFQSRCQRSTEDCISHHPGMHQVPDREVRCHQIS